MKCLLTNCLDASAVLAPPGYGPFAAWITGWSNWLCQVTGAPSVDYALSAMILAAASITNPDYVPTSYQTFFLTVFIMLIHSCISSMPTKWIANFNSWGSTLNIASLFVVIVMIPASVTGAPTSPKFFPSSQVWSIQNGTAWPDGVSVLMSFMAIIWTMSGFGMSLSSLAPKIKTEYSRRPIPSFGRMRQRQRCLPTCHRHDIRLRWFNGLGPSNRRRLHSH
jgi:amino acid transporter